jgi:hypothetical protein
MPKKISPYSDLPLDVQRRKVRKIRRKRRRLRRANAKKGRSLGLGSLFAEPKKRLSNRKTLKKVLGLAAKIRKRQGLNASLALKQAWGKVKRKGHKGITTARAARKRGLKGYQ